MKYRLCIILLLLILLSGCAVAQIKGNFTNEAWFQGGVNYHLKAPINLYLTKFSLGDAITDPYLIGEAKTGTFNSKSKVISDIPVQDILYNVLKDAFSKTGFVITEDRSSADLIADGEIQQFWTREYATGWTPEYAKAAVRYDIVLKNNSDKIFWAKSIDVETKSTGIAFVDATSSLVPTLKNALSQSMEEIINDPALHANLKKLIEEKKAGVDRIKSNTEDINVSVENR